MIVYDLRSPLAIFNIAEMIGTGLLGDLNDDPKNWTDRINNNASDRVGLVSDFLGPFQLEAGQNSADPLWLRSFNNALLGG